jgi:uncharacterized protein YdcH (DUF465 family)
LRRVKPAAPPRARRVDFDGALLCHGTDSSFTGRSAGPAQSPSTRIQQEAVMFPEYRQLITRLKAENGHFSALFQRHNDLDQEIKNMEAGIVPASDTSVEILKKEKLLLKDKLYSLLKAADQSAG